jgi:hypothetical protein
MLTNNASFFCWIPAVFKRYYTVMCLKHLIFFLRHTPSRQLFYQPSKHCVARRYASGLSSLNSTPLIAVSLPLLCFVPVLSYLHLARTKLLVWWHILAICSILSILTYLLVTFNGEYYWHYFFVQFQRLILNSYHS